MKKTLIFCNPEYSDLAIKLRDNYRAHDHEEVDIVSVEEHDDIEYAKKMQYDEAVFIEDSNTVTFHDIESGYTNRLPVSDVFYNDPKIDIDATVKSAFERGFTVIIPEGTNSTFNKSEFRKVKRHEETVYCYKSI